MVKLNQEIVTREKKELLKSYARVFQGIVSMFANIHFNIFKVDLIFKFEGGVTVNNRDIVIFNNCVRDDFSNNIEGSTEEKEVVKVIEKIFDEVEFNNLPDSLQEWVNKEIIDKGVEKLMTFVGNPFGDPLNSFFEK